MLSMHLDSSSFPHVVDLLRRQFAIQNRISIIFTAFVKALGLSDPITIVHLLYSPTELMDDSKLLRRARFCIPSHHVRLLMDAVPAHDIEWWHGSSAIMLKRVLVLAHQAMQGERSDALRREFVHYLWNLSRRQPQISGTTWTNTVQFVPMILAFYDRESPGGQAYAVEDVMPWCRFWIREALALPTRGSLSSSLRIVRDGVLASAALTFLAISRSEDTEEVHEFADEVVLFLIAFEHQIRKSEPRPTVLAIFLQAVSPYTASPDALLVIATSLQSLVEAGRIALYPNTSTGRLAIAIRNLCRGQKGPAFTQAKLILDAYEDVYNAPLVDMHLGEGMASLTAAEHRFAFSTTQTEADIVTSVHGPRQASELEPTLITVSNLMGHYVAAREVLPLLPMSPIEQFALNLAQASAVKFYQGVAASFVRRGTGRQRVAEGTNTAAREIEEMGTELGLLEKLPSMLLATE